MERLKIHSYILDGNQLPRVMLVRCEQRNGTIKWAIRKGDNLCFDKNGQWEYEPSPSSRTLGFIERCRWDTIENAVNLWRQMGG